MCAGTDVAAQPSQWVKQLSIWHAARQDSEQALQTYMDALAKVEAQAPLPPALASRGLRSEFQVRTAPGLTSRERTVLIGKVRAWQEAERVARTQHGLDAADAHCEEAVAAEAAAFDHLMETPAATSADFLCKYRLYWAREICQQEPEGAETPDTLAEMLTQGGPLKGAARLLQDALRLSGEPADLAEVEPFDVAGFVVAFERHPGHHLSPYGPTYRAEAVRPGENPVGSAAWDALSDWQKAAAKRFSATRESLRG